MVSLLNLNAGYVYVLMNPSLPGLVKIGMTTRDPDGRAEELSSATGVPTPFILVYKEYFNDCSLAEKSIHTYLQDLGYRVSNNREFFKMAIPEAIEIIQEYSRSIGLDDNRCEINQKRDTNRFVNIGNSFFEDGENFYHGTNGFLEDEKEALELFKKAAKYNIPEAFKRIGDIYYLGLTIKKNVDMALDYYKQGAQLGHIDCYGDMARLYFFEMNHTKNALKCWEKYFNNYNNSSLKYFYVIEYIYGSIIHKIPVQFDEYWFADRSQILSLCKELFVKYGSNEQKDSNKHFLVENYINNSNIAGRTKKGRGEILSLSRTEDFSILKIGMIVGRISVGDNVSIVRSGHKAEFCVFDVREDENSSYILIRTNLAEHQFLRNGGTVIA